MKPSHKLEVLNRISELQLDSSYFEHQLEDSNRTSASYQVSIESLHFDITLEIIDNAVWSGYEEYESDSTEIGNFEVTDMDGNDFAGYFEEDEIINRINY